MPKKVLIVGASGFVGSYLMKVCRKRDWNTIGTYSAHAEENLVCLDMNDPSAVDALIADIKPNIVFLVAFNPNVSYCEEHPAETRKTNVIGNKNIIDASNRTGTKVVYFSSDLVFSGTEGPYTEVDSPDPVCEYGRQKLEVERFLMLTNGNSLIIRAANVYGWEKQGKNFFCRVINTLKSGGVLLAPTDQMRTPTLVNDLAEASCLLVEENASDVVHVAGPDHISRYQFALRVAEEFGLEKGNIVSMHTQDMPQGEQRPLELGLISDRLPHLLKIHMNSLQESLALLRGSEVRPHGI